MRTTKTPKKFVFFGINSLDEMNTIDYPENSRVVSVVPTLKTGVTSYFVSDYVVIVEIDTVVRGEIDC